MDSQWSREDVFTVELPVEIAAIEKARLALLAYLAPFALNDRLINHVEVVLEEILSNVVRHSRDAKAMTVAARCSDGTVSLTVEDDGAAFDPLGVTEPHRPAGLGDAVLGGQGIPLIKRLSVSVSYDRIETLNRISALLVPT